MTSTPRSLALAALLLALPSGPAAAQESPLPFSSDRPGFSNATGIAPQGHLISEVGVSAVRDDDATTLTAPALLLRGGVLPWLELRVSAPSYQGFFEEGVDSAHGLTDSAVGLSVGGSVDALSISVVPMLSLPTGTDGFTASEVSFSTGVNVGWAATDELSFTLNGVATSRVDVQADGETRRRAEAAGGFAVAVQALPELGMFAQTYVLIAEDGPARPFAGGGFTVMITDAMQIDAYADVGLTSDAPRLIVGAGWTSLW